MSTSIPAPPKAEPLPIPLLAVMAIFIAIFLLVFVANKLQESNQTSTYYFVPDYQAPSLPDFKPPNRQPGLDPDPIDLPIIDHQSKSEPAVNSPSPQQPDPNENCKNSEALFALQELTEKSIKIHLGIQGELKRRTEENLKEWDEVYQKSIPEPMKIAVQIHCQVIQKTNHTDVYTKLKFPSFLKT